MMTTTLRRFLISIAKRSAARKYARYLGPRLQRDYGAGQYYTASQISAAAKKSGLSQDHIEIGFAAFMPQNGFANLSLKGDYQALRALYFRFVRAGRNSPVEPAEPNTYAWGTDLPASTSHHSSDPAHHE